MGRLVLARALLAQGDTEGASAQVREAWRNDALTADVEKQVLERYSEFLSTADHKARMEKEALRRRQRSRDAGGAPAGGRRRCHRAGAHRAEA